MLTVLNYFFIIKMYNSYMMKLNTLQNYTLLYVEDDENTREPMQYIGESYEE